MQGRQEDDRKCVQVNACVSVFLSECESMCDRQYMNVHVNMGLCLCPCVCECVSGHECRIQGGLRKIAGDRDGKA
jgi:hypothetical protein